jgi:hypothetical protein
VVDFPRIRRKKMEKGLTTKAQRHEDANARPPDEEDRGGAIEFDSSSRVPVVTLNNG